MPLSNPSAAQIAQLISQVTASAFLLGAVAVLISRMKELYDAYQKPEGQITEVYQHVGKARSRQNPVPKVSFATKADSDHIET